MDTLASTLVRWARTQHTRTRAQACIHTHTHAHAHTRTRACARTHTHARAHTQTHMDTHTHAHTQARKLRSNMHIGTLFIILCVAKTECRDTTINTPEV